MQKRVLSVIMTVLLILSMTGCGNKNSDNKDDDSSGQTTETAENLVLGLSFGQNVHPFFVAMQKGAEDAAKENNVELVVQSADSSLEKQVEQLENMIQRGCQAILLNPYDSEGVAAVVNEALKSDVGIFTMDIDTVGAESTSYVASDNVSIGRMLGEYVIDELDGKGKIAFIGGPSVTSLKDREQGFMDAIAESDIEIVANQGTAMEREDALASAETILQANPDIKAFVGINENSGQAILSACAAAGMKDVLITTVDATEENMDAIKNGKIAVGVSQDPYQMGYMSVVNAIKWISNEEVDKKIDLDCEYMKTDNIDKFIEREASYNK